MSQRPPSTSKMALAADVDCADVCVVAHFLTHMAGLPVCVVGV